MNAEAHGELEHIPRKGTARPGGNVGKAFGWMCVVLASFIVVAISGREAGRVLGTLDIMFYRSVISLVILIAALRLAGFRISDLTTRNLGLNSLRSVVHFSAQGAWLHALMLIPLTELFALEFTAPLWVAVLAPLLLGERITRQRVFAALLGFSGVLVIVRPGMASFSLGTMLAFLSAIGFALSMIGTKYLMRTDSPMAILFYMILLQSIIALAITVWTLPLPDGPTIGWLLLLGAAGISAHFGIVRAISHADAIVVAPMDFLRLPLITSVGVFVYNEVLDAAVVIGAAIVVAANILNVTAEWRNR